MPSLKLFHRNPAKPTLRERAASLKAGLARRTRREEPQEANTGRRSLVVGTLAAAVPLPVLALPAPVAATAPHPDQALLDAEAEYLRADAAANAARQVSYAAADAMRAALGPFPEDLVLTPWEARRFAMFPSSAALTRLRTRIVPRADQLNPDFGWTADGLRRAIHLVPSILGRAGQTPHRIRRWRGLLPAAEAYDARHDAFEARFRTRDLRAESRAADKARTRAYGRMQRIPATTVEGLGVHTRSLASTSWYEGSAPYTALLLSAAAITGVTLRQSDFDVPAWIEAWERIGGRVDWHADTEEWAFVCPSLAGASDELKEQVRVLSYERNSHSGVIYRWLEAREPDPRVARA